MHTGKHLFFPRFEYQPCFNFCCSLKFNLKWLLCLKYIIIICLDTFVIKKWSSFRFIILKTLRRDLIDCLPLPRRLKDYLNTPHYYSEELATQSLLTKKCTENNNIHSLSMSSRSSQSGTPPRAEDISPSPQSNCGWCLPLLGKDHCLTYILLNVFIITQMFRPGEHELQIIFEKIRINLLFQLIVIRTKGVNVEFVWVFIEEWSVRLLICENVDIHIFVCMPPINVICRTCTWIRNVMKGKCIP